MKEEPEVIFSNQERALIDEIAAQRGLSFEEAANALFREGLAKRVRKKTGCKPSSNVRKLFK